MVEIRQPGPQLPDRMFCAMATEELSRGSFQDMAQDAFHALVLTIRFKETLFPYYFCAARW